MGSWHLTDLPSVRREHLLIEFSGLRTVCPHGVFMSLASGDPTIWFGVMFIRKGPYASAILRFQISFPSIYPWLPPQVTFTTDMFHPLITPLTTYMYTTDIQTSGTVSAADDERLPPGGFSLRHGFPGWFGKNSRKAEREHRKILSKIYGETQKSSPVMEVGPGTIDFAATDTASESDWRQDVGIYELLRYIRSTFDDEDTLDQVPLNVAGNPGAWHAWRTFRAKLGKTKNTVEEIDVVTRPQNPNIEDQVQNPGNVSPNLNTQESTLGLDGSGSLQVKAKKPGDWNWDGVWEVRVKKCVETSISGSVLFGKDGTDDFIRFLHLDDTKIDELKENIKKNLEESGLYRRRFPALAPIP